MSPEERREKNAFIEATYVYAISQGQRMHSARSNFFDSEVRILGTGMYFARTNISKSEILPNTFNLVINSVEPIRIGCWKEIYVEKHLKLCVSKKAKLSSVFNYHLSRICKKFLDYQDHI